VKLSSLEYAFLPSTKVSIHAVDVSLPLKVSVSVRPDYPYVSVLELSLSEAPECNVRITPLSGER
jgi:Ca2+-dependent lipid-binding protein